MPWRVKSEALIHLTNNGAYLLMLLLSLLVFPAMYLRRGQPVEILLWVDLPLFVAATGSVLLFYLVSQMARGEGWARRLWQLPSLMGLGIGLSVNNTRAILEGLLGKETPFHRTPKFDIRGTEGTTKGKEYRGLPSGTALIELALSLYFAVILVFTIRHGLFGAIPFVLLFLFGYLYVGVLSVRMDSARAARS